MNGEHEASSEWDRIVADLRKYRVLYEQTWGGVDDVLLARFLAGTCSDEERQAVEEARGSSPAVDRLLNTLRDVLAEPSLASGSEPSTVAEMIWQAADNARILADRLGVWIDQAGAVLSEGLSRLLVDLQPAYARAMGPADELGESESRVAWTIPLSGQAAELVLTLWPTEKTERWNLVCQLQGPAAGPPSPDVRAELRDANGDLELSFRPADTLKEPVYLKQGDWSLSVFLGEVEWQIPIRLGGID